MQPTYFASFLLSEKPDSPTPSLDEAVETIARWIFDNPRRSLSRPTNWAEADTAIYDLGNENRVSYRCFRREGRPEAIAVRFEHPDAQAKRSRLWRTDVVLSGIVDPVPAIRFSITVAAGNRGTGIDPVGAPPSRPKIVLDMISRFGAREEFPLRAEPMLARDEEGQFFADFLFKSDRRLPVVLISRRNSDGMFECEPSKIGDRLAGIAHVCVAGSADFAWQVDGDRNHEFRVYDGAVRIYWPNLRVDDRPTRHRLWSPAALQTMRAKGRSLEHELLALVADASITRTVHGISRWEEVEREATIQALREDKDASDEWLQRYDSDLKQLDAAKLALEEASEKLREARDDVEQWKALYWYEIKRAAPAAFAEQEEAIPESARDAIEQAERDFENRLVLAPNAVRKQAYEYGEPELLYAAFRWLAETYWGARAGTTKCSQLDHSCKEACTFSYSAHQSESTMGQFPEDYEVKWNGQTMFLREHIGRGTSTQPRYAIRIAFFFDAASRKVVVGFIGQHQTTRKSN